MPKETVCSYENCCHVVGFRGHEDLRKIWDQVPVVKNIERKILRYVSEKPGRFEMRSWHTGAFGNALDSNVRANHQEIAKCGTAHCIAGWAQYLGGKAGLDLTYQLQYDGAAGAAIFAKSCGWIPNFHNSNAGALQELKARVAELDAAGL